MTENNLENGLSNASEPVVEQNVVVEPVAPTPTPETATKIEPQSNFKVFNTEAEFNRHAAGIRRNAQKDAEKEIFQTLGIADETEFQSLKETALKAQSLEKEIESMKVTTSLLQIGIPADVLDYAMLDLAKLEAPLDFTNEEQVELFKTNKPWLANNKPTPQKTFNALTQPVATSNVEDKAKQAAMRKRFGG